jgi:hypothetical protein
LPNLSACCPQISFAIFASPSLQFSYLPTASGLAKQNLGHEQGQQSLVPFNAEVFLGLAKRVMALTD